MATDSHGMGIPLPSDATKIHEFPKVAREGFEKVAEVMATGLTEGMDAAAQAAIGREIKDQDLITGEDQRLPSFETTPDHLAVVLDAERNETWLGANTTDGGPTPWAVELLRRALGIGPAESKYLFAVTDADRNLTDLTIRATDGQFEDFVIDRLKTRILAGFTAPGADALTLDGAFGSTAADIVPAFPNMASASGWGSSSLNLWAPRFTELFAGHGAAYFNGATPGETIEHICARLGSHPAKLVFPSDTIPASGAVTVTAQNMNPGATMRTFTGTVAGVPGTLSSTATALTFTRTGSGQPAPAEAGAPFIPDVGPQHRADVVVFEMGKNNLTGTAGRDALVNRMFDEAVAWLAPKVKRVMVLGGFVNTGATAAAKAQVLAVNAHRRARYGNLYIDVQDYLTGPQIWEDTGITPTAADREQQARGEKPDSLSTDAAHLNAAGQAAVFARYAARLSALHWY